MLPSPACGRGVGGEGRRSSSMLARHFVDAPAFSPNPSPTARERGAILFNGQNCR
ncbi:hypothetical protein CO2235_MP70241 [Cupriavidus oxalaticus]|uniref:Uncharacterized protein n=1 Tax=Cupriavidus oxalaticus TaxID=96344 RepID=A0A976BJB1_9BURK|nr:hypothetical protein CO2235_MP70241 [Cupriavidus oxalaticus]